MDKIKYSTSFKEIINYSYSKSLEFYNDGNENPNPYYIGFGNPNSDILIIGQEKAISKKHKNILLRESIDNPKQWMNLISENIFDYEYKFEQYDGFMNPLHPYVEKAIGNQTGQTWFYYQKLVSMVYPELQTSSLANSFFSKAFITELNHQPSKKSLGYTSNPEREKLWSFNFFRSFPLVILATGSYISRLDIKRLFGVKFTEERSEPYRKLVIYNSKDGVRRLINARQLSSGVSNEYIVDIANQLSQ